MRLLAVPLAPFLPKADPVKGRVLLVRDDIIGDLIYPTSAVIKWLTDAGYEVHLALRHSLIDIGRLMLPEERLIPVDIRKYRNSLSYRYRILKNIRLKGFETAIGSTIHSSVNDNIVRNSGAVGKWGYKRGNSFKESLRLRKIKAVPTIPIKEEGSYISVLAHEKHFLEQITGKKVEGLKPFVNIPAEEALIEGRYIHYMLEAGNMKRAIPIDVMLDVLKEIAERCRLKVVLTGLRRVEETDSSFINLTGQTTVPEVINIMAHAAYVAGNESGLTHLAWICGRPTAMIYGGGHFGRFYPEGTLILNNKLPCFGCDWKCVYNEAVFPCVNIEKGRLHDALASFVA